MASRDVLSLSLDDIIKMKNKRGRRGGTRGRGEGRGRGHGGGASRGTDQSFTSGSRGRGWARHRGNRGQSFTQGRGRGIVISRGRGVITSRGRGVVTSRGRGISSTRVQGRGVGVLSSKIKGRGVISTRAKKVPISLKARARGGRGRGGGGLGSGGRGGVSPRARQRKPRAQRRINNLNTSQEWHQQADTRDSSVRQQLARKKVEQARRTLAISKQAQSRQTRQDLINSRRGNVATNLRGSDRDTIRGGSLVCLTSQRGLTISIKNNIASSQGTGSSVRNKPNLNRGRATRYPSDDYPSHTFTVVNDRVQPVEPQILTSPPSPRRPLKRNFITTNDQRERNTIMTSSYPMENPRPIPETHRQLLDPKVQKEIAVLQGKGEVVLNNGPGPGVKGLRHIPSQTSRSLNERFTEERMVTD